MTKKIDKSKCFLIILIILWVVTIVIGIYFQLKGIGDVRLEVSYKPMLSVKEVHLDKIGKIYEEIEAPAGTDFYKIVTEITNEMQSLASLSSYNLSYKKVETESNQYNLDLLTLDDYVETSYKEFDYAAKANIPGGEVGSVLEILVLEEGTEIIEIHFRGYDNFKEAFIQVKVPK